MRGFIGCPGTARLGLAYCLFQKAAKRIKGKASFQQPHCVRPPPSVSGISACVGLSACMVPCAMIGNFPICGKARKQNGLSESVFFSQTAPSIPRIPENDKCTFLEASERRFSLKDAPLHDALLQNCVENNLDRRRRERSVPVSRVFELAGIESNATPPAAWQCGKFYQHYTITEHS